MAEAFNIVKGMQSNHNNEPIALPAPATNQPNKPDASTPDAQTQWPSAKGLYGRDFDGDLGK